MYLITFVNYVCYFLTFCFQQVLRAFKSILNKLTPEKYKKLAEDVLQLNINTEERLSGVTDLVFEKVSLGPCWIGQA